MQQKPLSPAEAQRRWLEAFGLMTINGSLNLPALVAEALRVVVWTQWATDYQPIHVLRLINKAYDLLVPWRSDIARWLEAIRAASAGDASDNARQVVSEKRWLKTILTTLEEAGDITHGGQGFWWPAPFRYVSLPAAQRWLMLGGPPAHLLPRTVQNRLEWVGLARLLPQSSAQSELAAPVITLHDWLGIPAMPLIEWTQAILNQTRLEPTSGVAAEIYIPPDWQTSLCDVPDSRYLMRTQSRFKSYTYAIANVQNERITAIGRLDHTTCDIRRLRYGLHALAAKPVQVTVQSQQDNVIFTLHRRLPRAEALLFQMLGRSNAPVNAAQPSFTWIVPLKYAEQLYDALRGLHVAIVSSTAR